MRHSVPLTIFARNEQILKMKVKKPNIFSGNYLSPNRFKRMLAGLVVLLITVAVTGCRHEEDEPDYRSHEDLYGVWTDNNGRYILFDDGNRAYNLYVTEQDGETIGTWEQDGYFYEPGYNLVIYIDYRSEPEIFQVVELTQNKLIWCWVDNLMDGYQSGMSIGEIIGKIIKDAHDGYDLDPKLYQYFDRVPDDEFYEMIERLDIMLPWD